MKDEKYLTYIKNAGEGATVDAFIEDWEPIGKIILDHLISKGLVLLINDKITLT